MVKRMILIDPYTRTITKVEAEGSIEEWRKLLQCEEVEVLGYPQVATVLLVDELAKIRQPKPPSFKIRMGFVTTYVMEIIGKALVVSHTLRGKTAHVKASIEEVSERVEWITTEQN